jgi:very-short-patch-repair endonuclease
MERVPKLMTQRARTLRTGVTDAERLLWRELRQYRPRFTRQLVIGSFIVDFACRGARLAVELDGGQHAEAMADDTRRTAKLEEAGWRVIRFWNNEVIENLDVVVSGILAAAAECLGGTHPRPLPGREGRERRPRRRIDLAPPRP